MPGNCDDSVTKLCEMLGWEGELKAAYDGVEGRGGGEDILVAVALKLTYRGP